MIRLFVAIDLPEEIRHYLAPLCTGLPGARWLDPQQLHLTLRFIGEVDGALFAAIREALDEVEEEPFDLALSGMGCFPPRGRPRVVWAGVTGAERLLPFQRRIEAVLVRTGLAPAGRRFAPHVTLARLNRTSPVRVARYLESHGSLFTPSWTVDMFHLYSSVLGRKGAQHRIEVSYRFG